LRRVQFSCPVDEVAKTLAHPAQSKICADALAARLSHLFAPRRISY
jgi:hypothetical protein